MNTTEKQLTLRLKTWITSMGAVVVLQACAQVQSKEQQTINIDGSSTVYPITEAITKTFRSDKNTSKAEIKSDFSGTGGGFKKFCAGETSMTAASRPILKEEMSLCNQNQVRYIELPIALDALTIVANPANNWANDITVEELKKIWQPEAEKKINRWQQVRSSWPDKPLTLYGPGKDSGTFDYFTEAIIGQDQASRTDYVYSEDDEALVNGVSQDPNALGYFGSAYYEENSDKLKAIAVDNGKGAVFPSREAVETAQYQPLSRPLFIYVNAQKAQENPALEEFVEYYLEKAPEIVTQVGYIPLPPEGYHLAKIHFQRGKIGTVFDGKQQLNLTIGELLRKQAQF